MPGVPASLTSAMLSASPQFIEELRDTLTLVVLVQGEHRLREAEGLEEHPRPPRVFGRDEAARAERVAGALGEVAQVADRRRHDVETTRSWVCHYTSCSILETGNAGYGSDL